MGNIGQPHINKMYDIISFNHIQNLKREIRSHFLKNPGPDA